MRGLTHGESQIEKEHMMTFDIDDPAGIDGYRIEPRCHVCRDGEVTQLVNGMLARGTSYAQIVRTVAGVGPEHSKVTIDSVRNHAARHFPVQSAAKATYREILERRAAQNKIDFVEGLATAITPIAYLETMLVKAFDTLVDDDTHVGIETGLRAAEKLHRITGDIDPAAELTRIRADVGRIIDAVKATVPQPMWADILRHLEGREQAYLGTPGQPLNRTGNPLDEDDDDDDEAFDPVEDGDDDDF